MATVFSKVFYKLAGKAIPGFDEDGTTALDTAGTDDLIVVQSTKDLGKDVTKDAINGGTSDAVNLNYDELRISSEKAETYLLHAGITGVERITINEDLCDETPTSAGGWGDAAINIDASVMAGPLTLIGNRGANALIATAQADTVRGGDGNDIITGGLGADSLLGGNGDDLFILKDADDYVAGETINGGATAGADKLVFDDVTANTTLTINTTSLTAIDEIVIGTVDKSGKISNKGKVALNVNAANASTPNILGNAGNNTLTGSTSANTIDGDAGDDTIIGGGGNGKDTLIGGAGKDDMTGSDKADTFKYLKTSDLADGEKVNGGLDANDVLLLDGSGTYAFKVDSDLLGVEIVKMETAGKSDTSAIGVDLSFQTETEFKITGNSGANKIITGVATYADITGGAGNDAITTGSKDDIIDGGAGNDVIISGDGSGNIGDIHWGYTEGDDITGGLGDDKITSGSGNDTIDGGLGKDNIQSGAGNDEIYGAKGDDVIDGGTGDDIIYGDEGADPGQSGNGADKLSGGLGSDTFVIEHVIWAKKDSIDGEGKGVDAAAAINDVDTVVFAECQTQASTSTGILKIDAKLVKGIETFVIDDNPNTATQDGTMPLGLDVSAYATSITLKGNAGNNILKAGSKNDTISGNAGNDTIIGNAGADTISGGTGADKFVFNDILSADTISDFASASSDKLVFSDQLFNLGANDTHGVAGAYTAFTAGILETGASAFTNLASANARFGFNTATGDLYYDADGSGAGATAIKIVTLTGVASLAEADLMFTA